MTALAIVALVLGFFGASESATEEGQQLYIEQCSGCHGPGGQGTEWGPEILADGAAGSHFWMATGRMPIRRPEDRIEPQRPTLAPDQIEAITRHVANLTDARPIPDISPEEGDVGEGSVLYVRHCAACHGTTGVGGAIVRARNATSILDVDTLLVAEAVRTGPGAMPLFEEEALSESELDSLLAYIELLQEGVSPGGWQLGRWGPVAEGAAAWLVGIGVAVGAAYWTERLSQDEHLEGS